MVNMKKISLLLSMIAFVSFVAIAPVSAGSPVTTKKATTVQPAPAAKKACCTDAKKACCTDPKTCKCAKGKTGKTCTEMKKTTPAAPKAK